MAEKHFFAGKWGTVYEHAKRFGVYDSTVRRRLARGYTLAEAIHEKPHRSRAGLVTAFGETHTRQEWSEMHGVTVDAITTRLRRGWRPERAVTESVSGQPIKAFGRAQSIAAWSRETGIKPTTLRRRICDFGMAPEVALTMPVQGGVDRA